MSTWSEVYKASDQIKEQEDNRLKHKDREWVGLSKLFIEHLEAEGFSVIPTSEYERLLRIDESAADYRKLPGRSERPSC